MAVPIMVAMVPSRNSPEEHNRQRLRSRAEERPAILNVQVEPRSVNTKEFAGKSKRALLHLLCSLPNAPRAAAPKLRSQNGKPQNGAAAMGASRRVEHVGLSCREHSFTGEDCRPCRATKYRRSKLRYMGKQ